MTTPLTNSPGLPAHRYAAHVETVLATQPRRRSWPRIALCLLAVAVSLGWLAWCFYSADALTLFQ